MKVNGSNVQTITGESLRAPVASAPSSSVTPKSRALPFWQTHAATIAIGFVLAVFVPLALILAQCDYYLVDDYRPYDRLFYGYWPQAMWNHFDLSLLKEGLYRPFPDAVEWLLAVLLRGHIGVWHVLSVCLRLLSIVLAWKFLGILKASLPARLAFFFYFAFFPAFTEAWGVIAEIPIMPVFLLTAMGLAFVIEASNAGAEIRVKTMAWIAVVFVLTTMSKEIWAPVTLVFLAVFIFLLWKDKRPAMRWLLLAMTLATALQTFRCAIMFFHPYASGNEGRRPPLQNAKWFLANTFLTTTNMRPTTWLLLLLFVIGVLACLWQVYQSAGRKDGQWRITQLAWPQLVWLVAFLLIFGECFFTPYQAVRYIYPASILVLPILVRGFDTLFASRPRLGSWAAAYLVLVIVIFNIPVFYGVALAMRASSKADWAMLNYIAEQYSAGREIAFTKHSAFFEPARSIQSELAGVNLTGKVRKENAGRILDLTAPNWNGEIPAAALVVNASPSYASDEAAVLRAVMKVERSFNYLEETPLVVALKQFEAFAQRLNRSYLYVYDGGLPPFPGHYWEVYTPLPGQAQSASTALRVQIKPVNLPPGSRMAWGTHLW